MSVLVCRVMALAALALVACQSSNEQAPASVTPERVHSIRVEQPDWADDDPRRDWIEIDAAGDYVHTPTWPIRTRPSRSGRLSDEQRARVFELAGRIAASLESGDYRLANRITPARIVTLRTTAGEKRYTLSLVEGDDGREEAHKMGAGVEARLLLAASFLITVDGATER